MKIYINNREFDTLELASSERQAWLKQFYHSGNKPTIRCGCNERTPMHIKYRQSTQRFYISTNPNNAAEHEEWCELALNLSEKQMRGVHYRAVEELAPNHLSIHTKKLPIFMSTEGSGKAPARTNRSGKQFSNSGITLGSLGRELMARAWEYAMEEYATEKKYYPSIKVLQIAINKLFLKPKLVQVKIGKKMTLADILWIGQKDPKSFYYYNKEQLRPLILAPLVLDSPISVQDGSDYVEIYLESAIKGERFKMNVHVAEWLEATKYCSVSYESHKHFFIVGVGEIGKYGEPPIIRSIELIPVSARGMYVDSSYEKYLFELFEKEKRLYMRSNQRIEALNGYLPDAMLLDTEKPCIVEVFGMSESNKDYHEAKNRKMSFYKSLEAQYMTLYWHAYRNSKLPALPPKKTLQLI